MDWANLAWDRDQWRTVKKREVNVRMGNFLTSIKMAVIWDVASCSPVGTYDRAMMEAAGYTAQQSRRRPS